MKSVINSLFLLSILIFASCNNSENENTRLLAGVVGGEEWIYKYAKASYDQVENSYDVEMFGEQQTEADPCSILVSGENFLSFRISNEPGNYQIPSQINFRFDLSGTGNTRDATSGFIEIIGVNEVRVSGYIQAVFDEGNLVEGNFVFDRCNPF